MSTTMCQAMGFFVSSLGFAGCIVATAMDAWSTQDLYDNPVTAVFQYQGLWRSCVSQSSGLTECRPYFTILGLPGMGNGVKAMCITGRVLSCNWILMLLLCLCLVILTKILTLSNDPFLLPGLCAICGVSVFANMLVTNFWMSTAGMYQQGMMQTLTTRYTFGAALFVGWVAGGLALVGGIMLCIACRGLVPEETHYKAVSYKSAGYRSGTAYEPKKTAIIDTNTVKSDEGRRSKYDYV
nr:claudin-18 [Pogona vitticeps]